jgi:hypothetical protein
MTGRKSESAEEMRMRILGSRMALTSEKRLKRLRLKKTPARRNMMTEAATMETSLL